MSGLASPDLAAIWCYAIVLLIGVLVARGTVNELLSDHPDHWAFSGTWWLFLGHALLPVVLFWFLDYTAVVRDTSLFAALIVAFGYRQIFSGESQSVALPPQAPPLWKPFQRWVERVSEQIATRQKRHRDRFDEILRGYLAKEPRRLKGFEELALARSTNSKALADQLEPLDADPPPPGAKVRRVRILLRNLRASEPEHYGFLLRQAKLIWRWQEWWWVGNGRARLVTAGMLLTLLLPLLALASAATDPERRASLTLRYHQWRFAKTNASERDRFRSHEQLAAALRRVDASHEPVAAVAEILGPLLDELRFGELAPAQADRLLRLVVDAQSDTVAHAAVPSLVRGLWTESPDVRLRIQRTLTALARIVHPGAELPEELASFVPAEDDTDETLDRVSRRWEAWWGKRRERVRAARKRP